jgi:hypothetical protein
MMPASARLARVTRRWEARAPREGTARAGQKFFADPTGEGEIVGTFS